MIKKFLSIFHDSLNSFEGQKEGEKVIAIIRKHPFHIIIKTILAILAGIIPAAAAMAFWNEITAMGLGSASLLLLSFWWLALWLSSFHALTMYTLDTVIITSERLIDNDQLGLFNRRTSELNVDRIQDVSAHTNGFIETLLNFGDITIQTAGADKHFIFHKVPRPEKVKASIMQMAASRSNGVRAD